MVGRDWRTRAKVPPESEITGICNTVRDSTMGDMLTSLGQSGALTGRWCSTWWFKEASRFATLVPADPILQLFMQQGCSVLSFVHMADNVILNLHQVKVSNRRPSIPEMPSIRWHQARLSLNPANGRSLAEAIFTDPYSTCIPLMTS